MKSFNVVKMTEIKQGDDTYTDYHFGSTVSKKLIPEINTVFCPGKKKE